MKMSSCNYFCFSFSLRQEKKIGSFSLFPFQIPTTLTSTLLPSSKNASPFIHADVLRRLVLHPHHLCLRLLHFLECNILIFPTPIGSLVVLATMLRGWRARIVPATHAYTTSYTFSISLPLLLFFSNTKFFSVSRHLLRHLLSLFSVNQSQQELWEPPTT